MIGISHITREQVSLKGNDTFQIFTVRVNLFTRPSIPFLKADVAIFTEKKGIGDGEHSRK